MLDHISPSSDTQSQPEFNNPVVLKLFDRRYATQLRRDQRVDPWTMDTEQQYRRFVFDGHASEFVDKLHSNESPASEEGDTWDGAQNEALLCDYIRDLYKTEVKVYDTLKELQGQDVPRPFACVIVPWRDISSRDTLANKYTDIPEILLPYIDGFPLTNIANHAPKQTW